MFTHGQRTPPALRASIKPVLDIWFYTAVGPKNLENPLYLWLRLPAVSPPLIEEVLD